MLYSLLSRLATLAIALLFALSAASAAAQQTRLPDIGTAGGGIMSIERELAVGEMYMRQIRASAPVLGDPVLNAYLHDVGTRLVRNANDVNFPFKFFWVNQNQINAFAFFGGHIGVNTGLIAETRNESELASVLAHEIAHVSQRHIVRNMDAMQRSGPTALATMLGSILLGIVNPELGMAAISASMAGMQQRSINYTRLFEQEADRIGITILAETGFDPMGAPDFFGRLAEKYRYASKPPEMLLTHPLSESRIADTRLRAERMRRPNQGQRDELAFWLAKYRVMVRHTKTYNATAARNDMTDTNQTIATAAQYGLAIALLDSEQPQAAAETLAPLLEKDPYNTFYLDVQTDIFLALQDYDSALSMLEQAYQRMPNEQTVTLNFANAAMQAGQLDLTVQLLRDYLVREPKSVTAMSLLVDAYQKRGDTSGMHETRAELLALYGQFDQAINSLHNAHRQSSSTLEQRRLQARIEQLMALKRQLEKLS
ncbi:Beta-barrel assembly-enhancing protease [Pseudidiomarina piscicola]|uniref:Putative beta-barrel assembly-enhancing protease n=1 Tax=Pseudidiomarina piscicola TaxID=2614830 RepID=A0A6S6WLS4_9GAMM|nr:M48 family metalloprotease [Pseudidiomarina piscicola]CAB0150199.1 Beta-barrel assembly-enhancing protease [Pseudidiomarina piscicola]VZT39637.1 Beta-barrel assembly-enhancing protease [Pseudomonas aeruginosa]